MLLEAGFFGNDPSQQKLLDNAYANFKAFIAAKKIPCSQAPFTKKMVARFQISTPTLRSSGVGDGWLPASDQVRISQQCCGIEVIKAGGEIQFTLKGYNGRVALEWPTHCLGDAVASPHLYVDPRMGLSYAAMILGLIFVSLWMGCWETPYAICHHMPYAVLWGNVPKAGTANLFSYLCVCVGCLSPRNHLSRFFGLMERNPRILHLWCRFDNYGNCHQNSVAFRLSSLALLWPNHSLRSHQASRDMYHSGLMFAKLHLVLSKKSFELLGCLKEDTLVCRETALLGVSLMCPLQDAETSLDHQAKSTCCLVSLAKINEPFNFAWSRSGFWSPTFGDQAFETLGYNHLVSKTLHSMQPSFQKKCIRYFYIWTTSWVTPVLGEFGFSSAMARPMPCDAEGQIQDTTIRS